MLPPFGEADGGQGVPGVGFIPEFPAVALPGLAELEDELELLEVEPGDPLAEPGRVLHGEPLVEVPELLELFGVVEGCVVLPGAGVPGEVDPGVVVFGVPFGDVDPGVVWVVGGVAVPVGGVAVPAGGVAAPGVELCPAVPELPAGAVPPAGELCATTQTAQHRTTKSKISFFIDMIFTSSLVLAFRIPSATLKADKQIEYVGSAGEQLSGIFRNSTPEYTAFHAHPVVVRTNLGR